MELYSLVKDGVREVESKPFKFEKEIQSLIESNVKYFFELEFIRTELSVGKYRIDSLCFDKENHSFVIIEYKKGNSYSVIDQGYTYLQLLLNNKSDFLLSLSQYYNRVFRLEEIDWSQSKIIFVSQSFNSYQKDSVNFKNLPFELWEIHRYTNNTIVMVEHIPSSNESIDSLSNISKQNVISTVSKEIMQVDEEFHSSKLSKDYLLIWDALKERFNEFDNVELSSKKGYISLNLGRKAIAYFYLRNSGILIEISRGNLNPDGKTSKNYFNIDDPKKISKEKSWEWKDGTKGNVYNIPVGLNVDLDYIMFLLNQKYKNLTNR